MHESGKILDRPKCRMNETIYRTGLCVSETHAFYLGNVEDMHKRLRLYKEVGFNTIRVETGWGGIEPREGEFVTPACDTYFRAVKEEGLRFKMILGTVMAPAGWYNEKYPGNRLVDHNGRECTGSPSFFAPHLREYLTRALDHMFQYLADADLLDSVDTMVVDFGPAGEPLYPPAWTQIPNGLDDPSGPEVFWGYDKYSQENFRETMRLKYQTIEEANAAWEQDFRSFDEVVVPKPRTVRGRYWEDYLIWYRDAKRDFIVDQVKMFKAAIMKYSGGRIRPLMYIPGFNIRDDVWQEAVETGDGMGQVRIMCDSLFLVDTARKYGCDLQYTGFENDYESRYLRRYMDLSGAGYIPFYGENAGGYDAVQYSRRLLDIIRETGMAGIDVTHSRFLFEEDGITVIKNIDLIKQAIKELQAYMKAGMTE